MHSIQTLFDVLFAFAAVVGVAAAITLAVELAGSMFRRGQMSVVKAGSRGLIPSPEPTQNDARELVLR